MTASSLLIGLLIPAFLSVAVTASAASEGRFQRDLESLLGASVATKHGQLSIRQRTDDTGRVRKQILVGPDFSEIQLDQDGDGSVDYWQVTRGSKVVTASEPYRGRFLRLVVKDRLSQGIQESTYLLDLGGRNYNLLKTAFTGKSVTYRADAEETFEAGEPSTPPALIASAAVPSPSEIEARSTRFELSEAAMIEHQSRVMGIDTGCESPDSFGGRLAELQREWWKILKVDVDQKADRLGILLKDSKMFDSSCKVPSRKKELSKMIEALSTVMLSSSKGEPFKGDQTRGRYLRCLEQSGLGITAAQIEQSFLRSLDDPHRTKAPITCSFRPGTAGASVPAEMNPFYNQISVFMTAADEGKRKNMDGSPMSYANVLFHEFIHVGGMLDEDITHAAQGCCGEGTDGRPAACAKLDRLVAQEKRLVSLETHLARTAGDYAPLAGTFEEKFKDSTLANKLYRSYLTGLDSYERGSPPALFANGLINDEEYSKCVASEGEVACRAKWTDHIENYTNVFFTQTCRNEVPRNQKAACRSMDRSFQRELARNVANSMISSSAAPISCEKTVSWNFESKKANELQVWESVAEMIFGKTAAANTEDPCIGEISPPSAPSTRPPLASNEVTVALPGEALPVVLPGVIETGDVGTRRVTPGDNAIGTVGRTDGRLDQTGSSGSTRPNRSGSPIPVTRVDLKNSKSFAENRYRRATDFVGSASRGLSAAREVLLPTAAAATRDRSRRSARLGPEDNFIAFRPEKAKELKIAPLDNPFSVRRDIASLGVVKPTSGSSLSGSAKTGSSGSASTDKSGEFGAPSTSASRSASNKAAAATASKAPMASGSATPATAAPSAALPTTLPQRNLSSMKDSKNAKSDPLVGLFAQPYRTVVDRLRRFDVVEALVARRIAIVDADGKIIGSKRPIEKFLFVGFEEPLKKSSE